MPEPQRTCVGCRSVDDQSALVRCVLVDGVVAVDADRRAPGRGAWLHPDEACARAAVRRGAFARSFRSGADASGLIDAVWPQQRSKG